MVLIKKFLVYADKEHPFRAFAEDIITGKISPSVLEDVWEVFKEKWDKSESNEQVANRLIAEMAAKTNMQLLKEVPEKILNLLLDWDKAVKIAKALKTGGPQTLVMTSDGFQEEHTPVSVSQIIGQADPKVQWAINSLLFGGRMLRDLGQPLGQVFAPGGLLGGDIAPGDWQGLNGAGENFAPGA